MELKDQVLNTRRQANRETLDFPNSVRAEIMNSTRNSKHLVISKDDKKHEIYVNAVSIDGEVKAWKYRIYIDGFCPKIEKTDLNPKTMEPIEEEDDLEALYLGLMYMRSLRKKEY